VNINIEIMSKSSLKIKKISSIADLLKEGLKLKNLRKAIAVGDKVFVKL
jgi:hypothetical protein